VIAAALCDANMSTIVPPAPGFEFTPPVTVRDVLDRLPGIGVERIRLQPAPGTATEDDVVRIHDEERRLYELVDGTLVEKIMGYRESIIAIAIATRLYSFVAPRKLGKVTGEAGMVKLFPKLVRIPDVAFVSWQRFEGGKIPKRPVPSLVPDLAVEVLSEGNTPAEMKRKLADYFRAGVRLVWLVDCEQRTVTVYTSHTESQVLDAVATLTGGEVLPGFELPLGELFAELDESGS
jgi:Uma2 family endonuclease